MRLNNQLDFFGVVDFTFKTCSDEALPALFHSFHAGICSATTPFVLLGDVLDCLPLDQCDKIFSFVEENVSTWKSVNNLKPLSTGSCSISPS